VLNQNSKSEIRSTKQNAKIKYQKSKMAKGGWRKAKGDRQRTKCAVKTANGNRRTTLSI